MEFLRPVLGEELYREVAEKLEGSKVKLADLSGGEYVGREKYDALAARWKGAMQQLEQESGAAAEKARGEMEELKRNLAAETYAAGIRFTSGSARRAFVEGLKREGLQKDESGELVGAEEYLKKAREDDPAAFQGEPAGGAGFADKTPPAARHMSTPQEAIRAAMFARK